jgi:mannose-6-phosphate isomerase-like protein (cupin superfamily)
MMERSVSAVATTRLTRLTVHAAAALTRNDTRPHREDTMRAQFLAFTFLAAITASAAAGQTAMTQFMSDKDIMALIEKAKADRKGDAPMVPEPVLQLAPYKAQIEYRPLKAPAAVHEKDAELFVVIQGTGDIITGGKLVNEKRINAANLTGSDISEGQTHHVVRGDVLLVPNNTPHQVVPTGGAPIVVMTMHVPFPAPANWP